MNLLERQMVDALKDLRESHAVIGVKAEFEAEGTRLEEALRLKEVVMKAGLGLTIKIGGCEALRDMYECRSIGVQRLVAPMIETAFALKKFISAARLVFPEEERTDAQLLRQPVEGIGGTRQPDAGACQHDGAFRAGQPLYHFVQQAFVYALRHGITILLRVVGLQLRFCDLA